MERRDRSAWQGRGGRREQRASDVRGLVLEQPSLARQASAKAGERAVGADHAVAGHDDGDGVLPIGEAPTTAGDIQVVYRPCPCCSAMMNRYNYARISGIILDGCKNHGLWFDRDELRRVLDFIQGGGLEKSRTREISRLEEEQRSNVLMTQMAGAVHPTSSAYDSGFGGHPVAIGLLGNLVEDLVDFFIL